jgi:hypothetical protein
MKRRLHMPAPAPERLFNPRPETFSVQLRTGSRGPEPKFSGPKLSLYPGTSLDRLPDINRRLKALNILPLKKAQVLRDGAIMYLEMVAAELAKIECGQDS